MAPAVSVELVLGERSEHGLLSFKSFYSISEKYH